MFAAARCVAAALAAERALHPGAGAGGIRLGPHAQGSSGRSPRRWNLPTRGRALSRVAGYDARDVATAAETAHRHTIMFWDALIWAVCDRVGIAELVTEDFQDGRRLGGVTFLNPFNPDNAARLGLPRQ